MTLKATPLNNAHRAAGARMVDFGGWDMPVNYGSQIEEHHAVRGDVGMFDVSHMCVVDLVGDNVRPFLRGLLTQTHPDGWTGCAAAIGGCDFYTTTAALRLPTLAIAGANDGTTPPDLVRETADLIPGSRFALLRGVGHLPMVEKPAEYAALLDTFLHDIGHG